MCLASIFEQHRNKVQYISDRVKHFYDLKQPFRNYHGSTCTTRRGQRDPGAIVDTSGLIHVLNIDKETMIASVESNVPMDTLLKESLKHGLIPEVTIDFPGITVGGAQQGLAGDTSSYKYGVFHDTIRRFEMVLGNGEVIVASKDENEDIFRSTPSTFGAAGVVTLLDVQLMPAKKYVEVDHRVFGNVQDAMDELIRLTQDPETTYIEGVLFSATHAVVMPGRLTDEQVTKPQRFTKAYNPWYFMHAEKAQGKVTIPVWDFLFRWDRGAFWSGKHAFEYFHTPCNRITRTVLDPFMKTRRMYKALQVSNMAQKFMVQDCVLPSPAEAVSFIKWVDEKMPQYPLYMVPGPRFKHPLFRQDFHSNTPVNVGFYGRDTKDFDEYLKLNREVEARLKSGGGMKWFYSQVFYTREELMDIIDVEKAEVMKKRCHAEHMADVYDKIKPESQQPISGLRGVMSVVLRKEHLLRTAK